MFKKNLFLPISYAYLISFLQDIPNILQILTFTSFLALIVKSSLSIALLTGVLLELFFLSKMHYRNEKIIEYVIKTQRYKNHSIKTTANKIYWYQFFYSNLVSLIFGFISAIIAIEVSNLVN